MLWQAVFCISEVNVSWASFQASNRRFAKQRTGLCSAACAAARARAAAPTLAPNLNSSSVPDCVLQHVRRRGREQRRQALAPNLNPSSAPDCVLQHCSMCGGAGASSGARP